MQPERAERIAEIVEQALEAEIGQRGALLVELCGDDQELFVEVASLLHFQEKARDFIETPAVETVAELLADERTGLQPGDALDGYNIVSLLGEGGMGEVYLAEDTSLRRKVAIKLLKCGLGTANLVRHFHQEEQILAGLTHPNIAQLYGGAVTKNGIPYFVMEYVEGKRLDDFCRDDQLSIRRRLELFRKICSAVSYAHQRLIIHRDIKPANIRVTSDGEPKLLDFGIAKLLDPATSTVPEMTMTFAAVMTPEYASPEQVRGERITTASDVYSLGVLLYELLTDQKPYKIDNRTPASVARAITEQEPTKPSTAVAKGPGDFKFQIPNSKILRGDLDNIVLKALRKEPERRYTTVGQFSEDIRRYLEGRPVIARKDTVGYRTSKFITRNKIAVAAAVLVLFAIIAGLIASLWQAQNARRQRDVARQEKVKAEQINTFLQSILSAAAPEEKGKDATVAEVVTDAAQRIDTEFKNQPEVKAQALLTIGRTYGALSRIGEAQKILQEALELNTKLYGENNEATAATMIELSVNLLNSNKAPEAEQMLQKGIRIERALSLSNKRDLYFGLFVLGELYVRRGNYEKAKPLLQEALALADKSRGEKNEDSAYILVAVGRAKNFSGDLDGAEAAYRRSIEIFRQLPRRYDTRMSLALLNLGGVLTDRGNYDEAVKVLTECDAISQKLGDSIYVMLSKQYLSIANFNKGDYASTLKNAEKSVDVGRRMKLENAPGFIEALTYKGRSLVQLGRTKEAEAPLREAIERARKNPPEQSWKLSSAEGALGECLTAQKRFAEAEPLLLSSYERSSKASNKAPTRTALQRLTALYQHWGQPDKANEYQNKLNTLR
jgi:eukaryotic-like serine/threonine-protein kinase